MKYLILATTILLTGCLEDNKHNPFDNASMKFGERPVTLEKLSASWGLELGLYRYYDEQNKVEVYVFYNGNSVSIAAVKLK